MLNFLTKRIQSELFIYTYSALAIASLIFILFYASPIIQVLTIILLALYLFTTEKIPVDMTALFIMIILILSGLVTPSEGVSGFSSVATITVLCMFVLSSAIEKTGIIQKLGNSVFSFVGNSEILQLLMIALLIAPLSGFVNNTAAVAIFLPMILTISKKSNTPATKLLIPLSYLSMLGGTLTLLGTSTNILANAVLIENNLPSFTMFEFMKIGLIVLAVGIIYFLIVGRYLLPDRKNENEDSPDDNNFLAGLKIQKGSEFIGKTIKQLRFGEKFNAKVLKLRRKDKSYRKGLIDKKIEVDDILIIFADEQRIIEFDHRKNEKLILDFDSKHRKMPAGGKIIKLIFSSRHIFKNSDQNEIDFLKKYGSGIIGVHRKKGHHILDSHMPDLSISAGEVLLVKVSQGSLPALRKSMNVILLEEIEKEYDPSKTWTTLSIIGAMIITAATGILPIMVAALCGVFLMFITGCLKASDIYQSVHWNIIFLLAGVIPLGLAMQKSGAADWIAMHIFALSSIMPLILIMGMFYLATNILTEIISNNAAVVLALPIAISVAQKLGADPKSFALIIMFAASTSFLSPIGYQTNTMVYGAGNYKFTDFAKVGAPLNIILLVLTTTSIYLFYHPKALNFHYYANELF